jgi:hypothetical protein
LRLAGGLSKSVTVPFPVSTLGETQ